MMVGNQALRPSRPRAATSPNSARCARIALISCVRWRTRRSRVRRTVSIACWSSDFMGTNRIDGRSHKGRQVVPAAWRRGCVGGGQPCALLPRCSPALPGQMVRGAHRTTNALLPRHPRPEFYSCRYRERDRDCQVLIAGAAVGRCMHRIDRQARRRTSPCARGPTDRPQPFRRASVNSRPGINGPVDEGGAEVEHVNRCGAGIFSSPHTIRIREATDDRPFRHTRGDASRDAGHRSLPL